MNTQNKLKDDIASNGFSTIAAVFTDDEITGLLSTISKVDTSNPAFRKTNDLFAIRRFFKEVPDAFDLVFNKNLKGLLTELFGSDFFVVKSIYFDKPANSNWFVAYHQDLTISVDKKITLDGYGPWTKKQEQYAVRPPLEILEDNYTIRIHLDDTDEENGALKVINRSHTKGICRPETIDWNVETETICNVPKGGVMFMKPLLLHASGRTTNSKKRRVIHIELSRHLLPAQVKWAERMSFKS